MDKNNPPTYEDVNNKVFLQKQGQRVPQEVSTKTLRRQSSSLRAHGDLENNPPPSDDRTLSASQHSETRKNSLVPLRKKSMSKQEGSRRNLLAKMRSSSRRFSTDDSDAEARFQPKQDGSRRNLLARTRSSSRRLITEDSDAEALFQPKQGGSRRNLLARMRSSSRRSIMDNSVRGPETMFQPTKQSSQRNILAGLRRHSSISISLDDSSESSHGMDSESSSSTLQSYDERELTMCLPENQKVENMGNTTLSLAGDESECGMDKGSRRMSSNSGSLSEKDQCDRTTNNEPPNPRRGSFRKGFSFGSLSCRSLDALDDQSTQKLDDHSIDDSLLSTPPQSKSCRSKENPRMLFTNTMSAQSLLPNGKGSELVEKNPARASHKRLPQTKSKPLDGNLRSTSRRNLFSRASSGRNLGLRIQRVRSSRNVFEGIGNNSRSCRESLGRTNSFDDALLATETQRGNTVVGNDQTFQCHKSSRKAIEGGSMAYFLNLWSFALVGCTALFRTILRKVKADTPKILRRLAQNGAVKTTLSALLDMVLFLGGKTLAVATWALTVSLWIINKFTYWLVNQGFFQHIMIMIFEQKAKSDSETNSSSQHTSSLAHPHQATNHLPPSRKGNKGFFRKKRSSKKLFQR